MIDDPVKTRALLDAPQACLPFEVWLTPPLTRHLRSPSFAASETEPISRADHGIWATKAASSSNWIQSGGAMQFIASFHLSVPASNPTAADGARYQKHRIKKLKKNGFAGITVEGQDAAAHHGLLAYLHDSPPRTRSRARTDSPGTTLLTS